MYNGSEGKTAQRSYSDATWRQLAQLFATLLNLLSPV
jgi:hypothetical protein